MSNEPEAALAAARLTSVGLRRIFGTLETDILEAVWKLTAADTTADQSWTTITAVCQELGPTAHYKTIQTVMNRLAAKRFLLRRHRLRAHEYRAALSREALVTAMTRSIMGSLLRDFGDVAVAQFVAALQEVEPGHLALLDQILGVATTEEVVPAPPLLDMEEPS